MLQLAEELEDESTMQQSFDAIDGCGKQRTSFLITVFFIFPNEVMLPLNREKQT
jgi:putative exporter of polyketide antibiotics